MHGKQACNKDDFFAAYYNKTFTLKQPDNTEVEVKITGDEYYQHIESIYGYTLCRNEEGWICYADINSEKSELLPTDKIYTGENYVEDISVWDKLFKTKSKKEKHITLDKEYSDKLRDEQGNNSNYENTSKKHYELSLVQADNKLEIESNCSSWESINALNDGFTPSNSNDRSHVVYGNWPSTSEEWVQYTFDTNQIVSKSNIYWFKDNAGIDVPSSYTIQYYDGFNWVDVQNPVGLGTEANTFNTTYFNPVITNSIRIKINPNNSYSTGILEWQLF